MLKLFRFMPLAVLILLSLATKAQQNVDFSHYTLSTNYVNPAAVGSSGMISFLGTYRSQYSGFEGSPHIFYVDASMGFKIAGTKHGVGISFFHNPSGIMSDQTVNLNYAYHFPLYNGLLSGGFAVNFTNIGIEKDKIFQPSSDYHDSSDPAINTAGSDFGVDLGVGFMYEDKKWFAGISLLNIIAHKYELSETLYYKKSRTINFLGGYNFSLNNPLYKIKTSALVKSDFRSWAASINATLEYNESYWGGIGYKIDGAVVFSLGMRVLNGLVIAYSYDLPTSGLVRSAGGHEVVLSYSFNVDITKKNKYKSIRYL